MDELRRWLIKPTDPFYHPLAADARLRPTDYTDDQVWRLTPGTGTDPALALQTQYGGRVGLASIIPIWTHDNRTIYETQAYAVQPVITGFAPGYLRVQASLAKQLAIQAEYWVIDSHTIGGRFIIRNAHVEPTQVHLDLFGHVGAEGEEQPLSIVPLDDQHHALHMGHLGNINPVVLLERGKSELVDGQPVSARIGRLFEVGGRSKVSVRWVHAGLSSARDSLAHAQRWLQEDWTPHLAQIVAAAQALPTIETGDDDLDITLATAYNQLVSAFLRPTNSLPNASFVTLRDPGTGYSRARDGRDYPRSWSGQAPHLAYLTALGIASIDAQLAQGIIRNTLAVQHDDGWIDWKPGLSGQQQGLLCMPVLARLTWGIFQYTEDDAFLRETFSPLLKFFERWQKRDNDDIPHWQHVVQTGYVHWPAFGIGQPWADNTDISTIETPDLLAYLLSEAMSLQAIAYYLNDTVHEQSLAQHVQRLQTALTSLWNGEHFVYRDHETHVTEEGRLVLKEAPGDEHHFIALPLDPPARLNIRVEGGVDHTPRLTMQLAGLDANGEPVQVNATSENFVWQRSRGVYTTQQVFSQVDSLQFDGLSRVYTANITTPNSARLDLNALLPLWSVGLPPEQSTQIIQLMSDPEHFWHKSGVTMCSAQDSNFDAANAEGSGGVWPYWLTLLGEGIIEAGRYDLATDLLARLLKTQVAALKQDKHFSEFYHSDEPRGLGTPADLGGIVPVHLLLRVLGVRVISDQKVWTGGPYHWSGPVTFRQHGVVIRRSSDSTQIEFPSGSQIQLAPGAEWQAVVDPRPADRT